MLYNGMTPVNTFQTCLEKEIYLQEVYWIGSSEKSFRRFHQAVQLVEQCFTGRSVIHEKISD